MGNKTFFESHFFSLEAFDRIDAGSGDDHIIAVGEIVDDDADGRFACGTGDQGVAIGHANRIDLAGDVGVHRRHIVKPLEFHLHSGLLEPAFLHADFPSNPAWPIGVSDFQRFGVKATA